MSIKKKVGAKIRKFIVSTPWFNRLFLDCNKFWALKTFGLSHVFIGTDSGHYGCNFSDIKGNCYDLTLRDSTILQNYEVLRNYSSYFSEESCTVCFVISPFDFLTGSTRYFEDRFYSILNMASIPDFAYERRANVLAIRNDPLLYYPLMSFRKDIFSCFKKKKDTCTTTAIQYLDHIKQRYSIRDFSAPLSMLNQDSFDDSLSILKKMQSFADTHNIKLILAFPPIPEEMSVETECFINNPSFIKLISDIKANGTCVKDYMFDTEFRNKNLYSSELYLSKEGASLFTKKILS